MADIGEFRGVALLQQGGANVIAVARGTSGTDPDAEITLSTRFQIASVSKQFTAAALLLLADRGVLSVAEPVRRWIDGCPPSWNSMTVHHLLTHTSGLVHWRHIPELNLTAPMAADDELRIFQDAPLLSAPGHRYSYSSPGYVLVARIVERAAGRPYAAFLAAEIFGPLGMTATFAGNGEDEPDLALGHADGKPVVSFELDTVGMGAGDIWSTVRDLARWDRALASGEILSDATRRAMLTAHAPVGEDNELVQVQGYGYGWYIGTVAGQHRVFFHTGDNAGFLALNAWFPDVDIQLAVLTNEESTDLQAIAGQLINAALT